MAIKTEVMESLKGKKFTELKELALAAGWAQYLSYEQDRKLAQKKLAFIGVKGTELIEFIADIEQQKADIKMLEDIEAEEAFIDGKITRDELQNIVEGKSSLEEPTPNDTFITLKQIASHLGITEKSLRRKLRNNGMQKPGGRWEWVPGDTMLNIIMAWKEEA